MYADDLIIFLSSKSLETLQNKIQPCLNKLNDWCQNTGFTFSKNKTVAMLFTRKTKNIYYPKLTLNGDTLIYANTHKFLGMKFDRKLTWTDHINDIKKGKGHKKPKHIKITCGYTLRFRPQVTPRTPQYGNFSNP